MWVVLCIIIVFTSIKEYIGRVGVAGRCAKMYEEYKAWKSEKKNTSIFSSGRGVNAMFGRRIKACGRELQHPI